MFKILTTAPLLAFGLFATTATAAPIRVGINTSVSFAAEKTALKSTLNAFGYTVVELSAYNASLVDVWISYAGGSSDGLSSAQVSVGKGYIQIGDWGGTYPSNYNSVGEGSAVTIALTTANEITQGAAQSWVSRGFHAYGYTSADYIGWSGTGSQLTSANGNNGALSTQTIGAGHEVFFGWNVYGPLATSNDLTLFKNSIEWAYDGSVPAADVPEPAMLGLFGFGALALAAARRRKA